MLSAENFASFFQASEFFFANHHQLGNFLPFKNKQFSRRNFCRNYFAEISVAEIQKQIEARDKARQEKNWQAADNIRKDLQSKGEIKLKDSEGKTHWYRSS